MCGRAAAHRRVTVRRAGHHVGQRRRMCLLANDSMVGFVVTATSALAP
jgi:hypothetical protein